MKKDFKQRLQEAIFSRGINASELSRLSGVGKADISNYLNGKYKAKQDKVYMLAQALDVDPGWLMGGESPKASIQSGMGIQTPEVVSVKVDPELRSMLRVWKVSSPKARKAAVEMLKVMSDTKKEG